MRVTFTPPALAHACEGRLVAPPDRLAPSRFAQLVLACRAAKERLLGDAAPDVFPVAVAGQGSKLLGSTLRTDLSREEAERLVLDGFFPPVPRDARPARGRSALVAFGLPYEKDPAITRHIAAFLARRAASTVSSLASSSNDAGTVSTTSCLASGAPGNAASKAARRWPRIFALASTGEIFGSSAASSSAPHGRMGAARSTAAYPSQLFADAIERPGTSVPRRRATAPAQ